MLSDSFMGATIAARFLEVPVQLTLCPYVTTGVAIVGASVMAVAPIAPPPTDVHVPSPLAQVNREVELAGIVDETINNLLLTVVATPTVRGTEIFLVPLAKMILPGNVATRLPIVALGIVGPLISGPAAIGTAIQAIIDGFGHDLRSGLIATLTAPATIIDGLIFGGYGPDLWLLVGDSLLASDTALAQAVQVLVNILNEPPPTALAGGLFNSQEVVRHVLSTPVGPASFPLKITLPGVLPLQSLAEGLLGAVGLGGANAVAATAVAPMGINNVDTANKQLVTLDVPPELGGKTSEQDAAAGMTLAPSVPDLPEAAGQVAEDVADVLDKTPPTERPGFGREVGEAARPESAHGGPITDTDTLDAAPGGKLAPETKPPGAGSSRGQGLNPIGATVRAASKRFGDAAKDAFGGGTKKNAVGGGTKDAGGED